MHHNILPTITPSSPVKPKQLSFFSSARQIREYPLLGQI